MESTKEVLVRRSNNLLYFPSNLNGNLYKVIPFRNNGISFTKTLDDVHFEGQWDGTENTSGSWGVAYCNIPLAAGTYTLSCDENYKGQIILQKRVGNTWPTIAQCGFGTLKKTFTLTEPTVIERLFWSNENMDKNVPIDMWMHPMLVEGDTKQDYEPYYHEYESTKEVLVRRSNNLLLPFSSDVNTAVGKNKNFSSDNTLFGTIETDGNIHIHGTKSVVNSGWYLISNFTSPLVLKAGKTYSYKYNTTYGNCTLQSNISGTRVTVLSTNTNKVTPTIDTPITHIYVDLWRTNKEENIGKEYDFYLNPIVVEGDTEQDYEPYYYEAEASKLITWAVDDTLVSVMDFSNMLYNKFIDNNGNIVPNGLWATTANFSPCTGNTVYWYNANMINYYSIGRACRFVFYDENKQFIGTAGTSSGKEDKSVTSPENARYMKASISRFGNNDRSQPFPIKPIVYIK